MKGYFMKGMVKDAMDLFERVLGEGSKVRFGPVSYNMVMDALAKNGQLDAAIGLFERMLREHDPPRRKTVNLGSFNVMIDGFCLARRFEEAIQVFKRRMGEKKCNPDVLSYNNLIHHLGKNGLVAEAEELYKEMGERGFSPDEYTYVLLVESCFGAGRPDDAVDYFNKMGESGLRPNANAYDKVIGGLADIQRLDDARVFLDLMLEREIKPNVKSYEMLVQSFCNVARLDDALKALKDLLMDEGVSLSEEMKELVLEALRRESREEDFSKLLEEVEREKAEAAARAAEEKAKAEALAREEEERKKAEKAAKEAAAARASAAAIEAVLGRKKLTDNKEEESPATVSVAAEEKVGDSGSAGDGSLNEVILENSSADVKNEGGGIA
ncbi:pentatricopeptide repeat-containing protein At3g49240-like isoform X2 [Phalaenopsis equestris]|nr:pentatricopeptide repeat-containing protein At3g49240-like isoform X2 [Phalaenopsis equestris]XP_020582062.1 pentatricopeptide repeat-containing protein At3g49240-like isoform X2 [Phalaenopsis equestris]